MFKKILFFLIICLMIGGIYSCVIAQANMHSANNTFLNRQYPIVGMNQISTKALRNNPGIVNNLAKLDLVIVNKSEDLFVDKGANTTIANQIRAKNPNTKVLQYLNITDLWNGQPSLKYFQQNHPQAILKGTDGNYVYSYAKEYGNKRYMMDSTDPVWQDYYAKRVASIVKQGMDGVFIDNTWRSNYQHLNVTPAKFKQLQQGWETMMKKAKNLIGPNKIIIGNSPPAPLYQTRDMAMLEGKLYNTKSSLEDYYAQTRQAHSYGQLLFDAIKINTYTGNNFQYVPKFFLPAVLMTDNIWGFSNEDPQYYALVDKIGKIGNATGAAKFLKPNVRYRDFTGGRVIINDSNSVQKITLPANTYKTINGTSISSVTLQPMEGIILKK